MLTSFILPAKNEAKTLETLLPTIKESFIGSDYEIIVVNDGSTDSTEEVCRNHAVKEVKHPYSIGNGAAIKSGARAAKGEILVFMDADGQHSAVDAMKLIEMLDSGYDMVVGARDKESHANFGRRIANQFYNYLASYITGFEIKDLTSGCRAVRANKFREFLYMLPNGFSYPTTSTMAFFRAGYAVEYVDISVAKRSGESHIRPLKDGVRFLLIIFKVGSLYSPLKLFLPLAAFLFLLGGFWYGYTYLDTGRFTNMSALLMANSILVFMMGLISEQITTLMYRPVEGAPASMPEDNVRG